MSAYNIKHRRYTQRSFYRTLILKLFCAIVLLAAMITFFYLPKFRVKNIFIQNNSVLQNQVKEEIKKALRARIFLVLPADNYFLLRKQLLADTILQNISAIKFVNFNREFPDTLIVNFEEKKEVALWCLESAALDLEARPPSCYFIDEDGVAFKKYFWKNDVLKFGPAFLSLDGERIELGDSVISKELLQRFLDFLESAENFFQLEAKKIILKENSYKIYFTPLESLPNDDNNKSVKKNRDEDFLTELKDGWFVLMDRETDFDNALENLKLVLSSQIKDKRAELEYIDLRFKNKVFFK